MTLSNEDPLKPDLEAASITAVNPRPRSSRVLNLLLGAAVVVAIAGVAFAVGRGTASASAATGPGPAARLGGAGAPNGAGGPGGGFGGGATGLSIEGTVTAIDGSSVTLQTSAGTTIQLSINGGTQYHEQAAATATDVATGSTVVVQVSGFAGRGGQPGTNASAAPSAGTGVTTGTATDITVVP